MDANMLYHLSMFNLIVQESLDQNFDTLYENNFAFLNIQLLDTCSIGLKGISKRSEWYLIVTNDGIVLYGDRNLIVLPKRCFSVYLENKECKRPIILQITDILKPVKRCKDRGNTILKYNIIE